MPHPLPWPRRGLGPQSCGRVKAGGCAVQEFRSAHPQPGNEAPLLGYELLHDTRSQPPMSYALPP